MCEPNQKARPEEPNQNPGGGKGEENRSSDIQGKEATVKIMGAKTAEDKPDKTEEPKP